MPILGGFDEEDDDQAKLPEGGVPTDSGHKTDIPTRLGKYFLMHRLGVGGMGQVWLANDTVADNRVAIKMLPEPLRANQEELQRLKRSFQLVRELPPHSSICQLYDLMNDQIFGYCIVMQYIDGETLSMYRFKYQQEHGQFTLSELVRLLRPIAEALDFAHDRKVLHRDVKPSNILISRNAGEPWIIDFQLAWQIRTSVQRVSREQLNDGAGTYPYMAPELWRGQRSSTQSDQYAFAMTAFELLEGDLPYEASDAQSWAAIVTNPELTVPVIDWIPPYAQRALAKALHRDPNERFKTCRQFIEALAGEGGRETDNFIRWKESDAPRDWVECHLGGWTKHDRSELLEELRRSDFWPMREDDLEAHLETVRAHLLRGPGQDDSLEKSTYGKRGVGQGPETATQVKVDGFPPLSDELLAAENEHHRLQFLLSQLEDGVHPSLEAGRKRLEALQHNVAVLTKEVESKAPQAPPGVLELVAQQVAKTPEISLEKLGKIDGAPSPEALLEHVHRLKRAFAARKALEEAQRQILVDRQSMSARLKEEVDTAWKRLVASREKDLNAVSEALFQRGSSDLSDFPMGIFLDEQPKIRLRRYHWSEDELLAKLSAGWKVWRAERTRALAWQDVQSKNRLSGYRDFLSKYGGDNPEGTIAKVRIDTLAAAFQRRSAATQSRNYGLLGAAIGAVTLGGLGAMGLAGIIVAILAFMVSHYVITAIVLLAIIGGTAQAISSKK